MMLRHLENVHCSCQGLNSKLCNEYIIEQVQVTYEITVSTVTAAENRSLGNIGCTVVVMFANSPEIFCKTWKSGRMLLELSTRSLNSWALISKFVYSIVWHSATFGSPHWLFCTHVLFTYPVIDRNYHKQKLLCIFTHVRKKLIRYVGIK